MTVKIVSEDYPPDTHAKSFRAGDEIAEGQLANYPGLKTVGADTKAAARLLEAAAPTPAEPAKPDKGSAPKSSDGSVDPAPDSPNGEANDRAI